MEMSSSWCVRLIRQDGNEIQILNLRPTNPQVQNTLYRIHKDFFARDAETFASMFTLHPPAGERPEGDSDEDPIELQGQDEKEFECFLTFYYPKYFLSYHRCLSYR